MHIRVEPIRIKSFKSFKVQGLSCRPSKNVRWTHQEDSGRSYHSRRGRLSREVSWLNWKLVQNPRTPIEYDGLAQIVRQSVCQHLGASSSLLSSFLTFSMSGRGCPSRWRRRVWRTTSSSMFQRSSSSSVFWRRSQLRWQALTAICSSFVRGVDRPGGHSAVPVAKGTIVLLLHVAKGTVFLTTASISPSSLDNFPVATCRGEANHQT